MSEKRTSEISQIHASGINDNSVAILGSNNLAFSSPMAASYTEIAFQTNCTLKNNKNFPKDRIEETSKKLNDVVIERGAPNPQSRPVSLYDNSFPFGLEGTLQRDGEVTHFVVDNLEYKIKLSSPITKREYTNKDLVAAIVELPTNTGKAEAVIFLAYLHRDVDNLEFLPLKGGMDLQFIVGCDANAHHTIWGSADINRRDINQPNVSSRNSTPSISCGLLPRNLHQSYLTQIDSTVLNDIEVDAQYLATSVDNLTENLYNLLHSISSITVDNVEIHRNSVNKLTDNMDANIKCMYTIMAKTEEISKSMKPSEQLASRISELKRLIDMLENNL